MATIEVQTQLSPLLSPFQLGSGKRLLCFILLLVAFIQGHIAHNLQNTHKNAAAALAMYCRLLPSSSSSFLP